MEERRRLPRTPLVGPLEIYSKDVLKKVGNGYVIDLNEHGMRIISNDELKVGDEFSLHFHLPNDWHLDFLGTVIHKAKSVSSNAYGLRFSEGQGTVILKLL